MNISLKSAECPVCFEYLSERIFQCYTGHSFCDNCKKALDVCPMCKEFITDQRNYAFESILKELRNYNNNNNNDHKFLHICPYKECEYEDADMNEILSHLVNIHVNQVLVCDSELFRTNIRITNNNRSVEYFSKILIYKRNIFKLWIKIKLMKICFTLQMVNYTEKCSHVFQVDYIKCVRRQYTAKVSAVTDPEKAFDWRASYVEFPKQLFTGNKERFVIYGRIQDNPKK